jgi:serine/threonine-protein kinase
MTEQPDEPAEVFGPFLVFERLGVGGTASVFRALRTKEDGSRVEVSLKRLHPHLATDERVVKEFVHEADIARLMQHENISRFYEIGRLGHDYFIATEYIEGTDLGKLLQRAADRDEPPPISVVLSLLVQLCGALEYAHERVDDRTGRKLDFVHRDISPSNLIITPTGQLKLIDMGIAKAATSPIKTENGIIKGKLSYMAPEVIAGSPADRRADIFAIGVVGWELVTARRLFGGGSERETIEKVQAGSVRPPSARNPACPPQLDDIILRALAPRPVNRWSTAGILRRALTAVGAAIHEPIGAAVVADWLRAGEIDDVELVFEPFDDDSTELAPPPTPTPSPDQTTQVRQRKPPTMPRRPHRFPAGTGALPLAAPDDTAPQPRASAPTAISHRDAVDGAPRKLARPQPPASVPLPLRPGETSSVAPLPFGRSDRGRRRRIWSAILGASLVVNVILTVGLIAAQTEPADDSVVEESVAGVDRLTSAWLADAELGGRDGDDGDQPATELAPTPAPAIEIATDPAPAGEAIDAAPPPVDAGPDAAPPIPTVPFDELDQTYGRTPRSRASRARWRATICIDRGGKVQSVEPLEGPERLERRLERTLGHWRFRPHPRGPVCAQATGRWKKWIDRKRRR